MKVLEFLEKYKDGLSVRGIEKKLGIPTGTLRRGVKDGRIPYMHEVKVAEWFGLDIPIEVKPSNTDEPRIGDKMPIEGWRRIAGSVYSKDGMFGVLEGGVIRITKV